MPLAAMLLLAVNAVLIAHAAKTGRFNPWAYVIFMLPGLGALAYTVVEVLPVWVRGRNGQAASKKVSSLINPLGVYNVLRDELATADTVYNRVALARECMAIGRYEEALQLFHDILENPQGDEPNFYYDKARVEFELGHFPAVLASLEELKKRFPDWRSPEAHLLYARAAEAAGFTAKALQEYRAVSQYFLGAEAPVRHALYLQNLGSDEEAKAIAENVVAVLRRAPRHVQKAQSDWAAQARKILKN